MRMVAAAIAAAATLAAAQPAAAAEWWIVMQQDTAGNVHFGETAQLRREGAHVTFWSHLFYKQPERGMKSARIQYEVDCVRSAMRERRYLDFGADRKVMASGDNTSEDGWREVAPDTTGAAYVSFACTTPEDRKANHVRVANDVSIFDTAEFFMDPSPIVSVD